MGADAASLPCPICLHTGVFDTAQSLKERLIFVSTNNILCPVCQEEVSGIDKLTIHLFSHVKLITSRKLSNDATNVQSSRQNDITPPPEQLKKTKTSATKNKTADMTLSTPVKFVKIYPKLPVITINTVPVIDMSTAPEECLLKKQPYASTIKSETHQEKSNKCDICGLKFIDINILNMHKCLIHNVDDKNNYNITRYDCHLCPKNFKMRGSLMVHLRVAHYGFAANNSHEPANQSPKNQNENSIEKPIDFKRQDGKHWQCDVCHKCFTTKYFLKKHKRLHTGETPYACTQCNKTFTFQQSYHKHLLYHNDEKPHACNFCGRAFKELSTLHNHQRIHTGEKPFACETCGKCFRQRVSYLVHRRIHTGAMPYKCTACDKNFRYKVSQRTHRCQVQPPGTVVRKIGVLVEKLKQKHSEPTDSEVIKVNNLNYTEISEANAELVRTGAQLSLEDMVSDTFQIISYDFNQNTSNKEQAKDNIIDKLKTNIDVLMDYIPTNDKSIPSPSDILQNLNLSKEEELLKVDEKTYESYNDFNRYL